MTKREAAIQELARAIAALAVGDDAGAAAIVHDLARALGRDQQTLPGIAVASVALDAEAARKLAVGRLFARWRAKCNHPTARLTPDRERAIAARLREGYTEREIERAIDGAASAPYVDEATGQRYDDLALVCRNGSKLESFIARGVLACGEIAADVTDASPLDEQIAALRRTMSELRKAGRTTEYEAAAADLAAKLAARDRPK